MDDPLLIYLLYLVLYLLLVCLFRYEHNYTLHMEYKDGITNQYRKAEFTKSVANFFDENGYLCSDLFEPEVIRLRDGLTAEKKDK